MIEAKVERVRAVLYVLPEAGLWPDQIKAMLREDCAEEAAKRGYVLRGEGRAWQPEPMVPGLNTKPEGVPPHAQTWLGEWEAVRLDNVTRPARRV